MTKQQVIQMINAQIITNHNEEITAAVLNPILLAMVGQINDLVGNPANLTQATVIDEIIYLGNNMPQGLTILSGSDNPNQVPPTTFEIGDFYQQIFEGNVITFYQYNGIEWAEVLSREKIRGNRIRIVTGSTSFQNDDVIIYNGTNTADVITVDPTTEKTLRIVNQFSQPISLSENYVGLDGVSITAIPSNSVVLFQNYNGTFYQLNNQQ